MTPWAEYHRPLPLEGKPEGAPTATEATAALNKAVLVHIMSEQRKSATDGAGQRREESK
jgi:hypothetical protein